MSSKFERVLRFGVLFLKFESGPTCFLFSKFENDPSAFPFPSILVFILTHFTKIEKIGTIIFEIRESFLVWHPFFEIRKPPSSLSVLEIRESHYLHQFPITFFDLLLTHFTKTDLWELILSKIESVLGFVSVFRNSRAAPFTSILEIREWHYLHPFPSFFKGDLSHFLQN